MVTVLQEKANLLGIYDAGLLTERELESEVRYASLSKEARDNVPRKQAVVSGITCVTMPDPVYIPITEGGVTLEYLKRDRINHS